MIRQSIFNHDFKSSNRHSLGIRLPVHPAYLLSATAALLIALTLAMLNPEPAQATRHSVLELPTQPGTGLAANSTPAANRSDQEAHPEQDSTPTVSSATANQESWHEVTVQQGDSLATIFKQLGIAQRELHNLLEKGGATDNLKKIFPGQTIRIATGTGQQLERLSYPIDQLNTLEINRNGDDFDIGTVTVTPEFRTKTASGKIDSSLFLAASEAGLSDSMTMELAGIFGWDIDFVLDIRTGDQFTVLYQEMYVNGENIGNGTILAAEFVNRGDHYQAIRYTDAGGKTDYYSLDGKSMRKAFLRTPVEFSRISSRFSLGRKHPILNKIRAHKGVDYAAATGTPIKATGDGKIVFRGKKGGYGNVVVLQHGSQYSTLYGHLSNFRKGQGVGGRVKQGDTIGYVGSTGLATGPHLHYEFLVNGVHRDPLRIKLPGADPLQAKYLEDFQRKAESLLTKLDLVRDTQVAINQQ